MDICSVYNALFPSRYTMSTFTFLVVSTLYTTILISSPLPPYELLVMSCSSSCSYSYSHSSSRFLS
jgi:hypothetical protein